MNNPQLIHQPDIKTRELLESSNWTNSFTPKQIEVLARHFNAYSAPTSTIIFKEGQTNDFFALVCEGMTDITKETFSGNAKILQTMGAGKAIGEMSFFDYSPCSANVTAKIETTLLVMDREHFESLTNESPRLALEIALKVIQTISQRLRQTSGRLIDLI